MIYRQSLLTGVLLVMLAELMFVTMGAIVKTLSLTMPNEVIVFLRNLFGLMVLTPIMLNGGLASVTTKVPQLHLLRSLAGVTAMYCFFYALGKLQLADAMLLKLTTPIFIPVIAYLWLSEHLGILSRWAVVVGFTGVILILEPTGDVQLASLVGLAGGAFAAFAKVVVRRMSMTEPATRTVFYFALIATLVSLIPMLWAWQTPSSNEWLLLILLGAVASLGQFLLTRAYSTAPAGQIGPFTYISVVYAALAGWLFWNEVMTLSAIIGALLIFAAGMIILQSNRTSARTLRTAAGSR